MSHPEAIAVRTERFAVTYQVLAQASRMLAARLAGQLNQQPGPVAVILEPGPGYLCSALAALRCGRPYLPIDPSYPSQRIDVLLADAAPAAVLRDADPDQRARQDHIGQPTRLDAAGVIKPIRVATPRWPRASEVNGSDAYVIYTSGSTGTPKGIVIPHRAINNMLDAFHSRRHLPVGSVHSAWASPGFDASILEIWTALTTGGELVVTPEGPRWHAADFIGWLADQRVAHAFVPAAYLPALAQAARSGSDLRFLQRVVVGVEPIARGLLGSIKRALPGLTLLNGYGPAEATVCCLIHEVTDGDDGPDRAPIGTPIHGVQVAVEAPQRPLAAGHDRQQARTATVPAPTQDEVRGELHIGGIAVGRYLHPEPGDRPAFYLRSDSAGNDRPYYRTGDLVRVDASGCFTFIGRTDDMIKIRGYRVEPGDVEAALLKRPEVAQALVLARPAGEPPGEPVPGRPEEWTVPAPPAGEPQHPYDGHTMEHLVAFVVLGFGAAVTSAELQSELFRSLPWYAVPHRIVVRDALPLTEHGKVDRRALINGPWEQQEQPSASQPQPLALRGTVDTALLRLWQEVLGPGSADPSASFLANGGGSLAAGRLATALTGRFGRRIRMLDILRTTDLGDLQSLVHRAPPASLRPGSARAGSPGSRLSSSAASADPPTASGAIPATHGQRALWFHQQLNPGSVVYNEAVALRWCGPLDRAALRCSLDTLVARHEALRTHLMMGGDQLQQCVAAPAPIPLTARDLRDMSDDQRRAAVDRTVREAVREPFDLTTGPQLRALLIRCGEREHLLVLAVHHSAIDGCSVDVLLDELASCYTAFTEGHLPELAPPPAQYRDHALAQWTSLRSGALEQDLAYWREQLAGLPRGLGLPTDRPRPRRASGQGAQVRTRLPAELVSRIDRLAQASGATRYTAFLAALHVLVSRYCGAADVAVGTPLSGRVSPEIARCVGYFLNVLPLRANLSDAPTFRHLLARTQRTVGDAYTHQRIPFPCVAEDIGANTSEENPFFQVCLVPEDVYRHEMEFAGIRASFEYYDTGVAKFDLTVNLVPDPEGGQRLIAEYRTDLFEAATIVRLLGQLRTLLESATGAPDQAVTLLGMLPEAEYRQVTGAFDGAHRDVPADVVIHRLVDAWAERTPHALALITDDVQLTYRQLTERANQWANHLADQGITAGSRVGVCLPRGVDTVIAFLAVLKTGAAYVPLDPANPPARLALMTDSAQLDVTLTTDLMNRQRQALSQCSRRPPTIASTSADIAYVIHTSGSTGTPKGVPIRHRSVADLVLGADYAQFTPKTRLLHASSPSFDLAAFDIWGTLLHGGALVVAPEGTVTAGQLAELVRRHRISHATAPTALFHRHVEQDPGCLAGLGTVIVGGEPLHPTLARAALAANPALRLINGYGPTEATTFATYHLLTGPDQVTSPVPIGRPTANTIARILDPQGQPVPIGVPGELHLGGPGVTDGYLGQPELTSKRFTADPQSPGRRLYHTGDLALWRPDGSIDCLGRLDDQFKLHGYRMEPGEIETVLRTHPAIAEAVVAKREDHPGHPYLAAYYSTTSAAGISPAELSASAATRLPPAMVPRVFTPVPHFPVTTHGKIDRAALPPPATADTTPALDSGHGAPSRPDPTLPDNPPGAVTPLAGPQPPEASAERSADQVLLDIAAIWRAVIVADHIGLDERLFDIGGASLQVMEIHRRVAARFTVPGLRVVDLFTHPTIRGYAAHVAGLRQRDRSRRTNGQGQ